MNNVTFLQMNKINPANAVLKKDTHEIKIDPAQISFNGLATLPTTENFLSQLKKVNGISFGANVMKLPYEDEMVNYINHLLLNDFELKPGQPIKITATRDCVPFVNLMMREAYKKGSGKVIVDIIEPEIEKIKKQYKAKEFDWKMKRDTALVNDGAAFVFYDDAHSPYKLAGLTDAQAEKVKGTMTVNLPDDLKKALEINPKDIIDDNLNLAKGQPVYIVAEREHEPNVHKLVEYALKKDSGPIDVLFVENKQNNFDRTKLLYANENIITDLFKASFNKFEEHHDKNTARIVLVGDDPKMMEDIDPAKISTENKAHGAILGEIKRNITADCPRSIYYAPTTAFAISAYPEYGQDKIAALKQAAIDAPKINRTGSSIEHLKNLQRIADKLNNMVTDPKDGLSQIRFVSVDPGTKEPDGKTNLTVGLSDWSLFSTTLHKTLNGQEYAANTPSEEIFTTPDNTKAEGTVYSTMPLFLDGKLVEGIKIEFANGKIVKASAEKNGDVLLQHIKDFNNADRLGEVSLVAGSPIGERKRAFKTTLIDENGGAHLALGNGYPYCIRGIEEIKDAKLREEHYKKCNYNKSDTHVDFVIGGPNVYVDGITKSGKVIPFIRDDKFQI